MKVNMTKKDLLFTIFISLCVVLGMALMVYVGKEGEIEAEEYADLQLIMRDAKQNDQPDIVIAIIKASEDKIVTLSEYQEIKGSFISKSMHQNLKKNDFLNELEEIKFSLEKKWGWNMCELIDDLQEPSYMYGFILHTQ